LIADNYLTIREPTVGIYKDRGSKFLAFAFPVESELEIASYLDNLKKDHPKARHHCYAWRLGISKDSYRANDDGEPSGTAGKPILGQIDSFGVTNVLIVVVRYFGGTLLGTSGLIQAYKTSAQTVLDNANTIEQYLENAIEISSKYPSVNNVISVIKQFNAKIIDQKFELNPKWVVTIRQNHTETFILNLKSSVGGISLEEATAKNLEDLLVVSIIN